MEYINNMLNEAWNFQASSPIFFYQSLYLQTCIVVEFVRIFQTNIKTFMKVLILFAMMYHFYNTAWKNCQHRENHLKMFKIRVGFTHSEFLKNSRSIAGYYHPDNSKTGDSDKFLTYSELRDVLGDSKNKQIIELYNEYGPVVDLLSIHRTDLTKDTIGNINFMEGLKHQVMAMILGLFTVIFIWDSADRGIIQQMIIATIFLQLNLYKVWVCLSNEVTNIEFKNDYTDIQNLFDMRFAIKPDLVDLIDMFLCSTFMSVYMFGVLFQPSCFAKYVMKLDSVFFVVNNHLSAIFNNEKSIKEKMARGELVAIEDRRKISAIRFHTKKNMDLVFGDAEKYLDEILGQMVGSSEFVSDVMDIWSTCFIWLSRLLIFSPLIILIVVKYGQSLVAKVNSNYEFNAGYNYS